MWLRLSVFFFFKQKTAYEMRISDWSSDVCSSDLLASQHLAFQLDIRNGVFVSFVDIDRNVNIFLVRRNGNLGRLDLHLQIAAIQIEGFQRLRSEEHTSELQSLMRISYAVFCLKKKNNISNNKQIVLNIY